MEPGDEGVYTCQIITKLDMAEASSTLTLCGKITDHILYDKNQQLSETAYIDLDNICKIVYYSIFLKRHLLV